MTLTNEQPMPLDQGEPVAVIVDHIPCILIRRDAYEATLRDDGDWTDNEMRTAMAQSSKGNGGDETEMDAYDRLI